MPPLEPAATSTGERPETNALFARATRLHLEGPPGDARGLCEEILACDPSHRQARYLAAIDACRRGEQGAAVRALRTLLQTRPDDGVVLSALGVALHAAGRRTEAENALAAAARQATGDPRPWFHLGNLHLDGGDPAAAAGSFLAALERRHGDVAAHLGLARAHLHAGRLDDALASLERAAGEDPPPEGSGGDDPMALLHGRFAVDDRHLEVGRDLSLKLAETGRRQDGVAACRAMVALFAAHGRSHYDLGAALEGAGDLDGALAAYGEAAALAPRAYPPHAKLGSLLLLLGRPREAVEACEACLALLPGHAHALGHLAVALDEIGEHDRAARLLDFERFVRPRQWSEDDTPSGLERLNEAVARAILDDPDLGRIDNSVLARGRDLDGVFPARSGPFKELEDLITRGIRAYIDDLPAAPDHPFTASRPRRWWLKGWGTVLQSGHQAAHMHMEGWLSGTYYARVPETVRAGGGTAGHLLVGRPPRRLPLRARRPTVTFRPAPGRMVLFPSYVFHETIPFESDQLRITVSFDVRPAR